MSAGKTIFKKIIDKEIPAKLVYEDDRALAFHDVSPKAPIHILVIPKKEVRSLAEVEPEDEPLIGHLFTIVRKLSEEFQLTKGFRVVINTGADGGQSVDHLHLHLLGQRALGWPPG